MKKNGVTYFIAFLCFACAIGGLCYAAFSDSGAYFLNVGEAKAMEPDQLRKARLFGLVSQDSMARQGSVLSFNLQDKDNESQIIPVQYSGIIPDSFKTGAEVIVEGSMNALGQFMARTLMTKCPSKYQKQNRPS